MAEPVSFPEVTTTLQPSGATYSDNVTGVSLLPTWSDGEQCVSCWKLSMRERVAALLFGRIWLAVLSGRTQSPAYITAARSYFTSEETPHV